MQKIIVIEDNPVFCDYICNYLRKNGMETEKTYSVAQARKLIEAAGEDAIVLSDLRLADGNGIELLQWMRKQGKNQPFIMMTDYAEVHTAVETMKSGAEDYVPKKLLEEKILAEGQAVDENILKVDSFINHKVDPVLMMEIGKDLANHYKDQGITKVVTIESSGIAPALATALAMGVPLVILKKQPSKVLNKHLLQTEDTSFTKGTSYELTLSAEQIDENDHVLIVDDFLANGEAATGAIRLLRHAHATVAGLGILIEKSFQPGREKLQEQGIHVYSLARIIKMAKDYIEFIPEENA